MFCTKRSVFIDWPRRRGKPTIVAVALTAYQPSMAFAGSGVGQRRDGDDRDQHGDRFSAPAVGAMAVVLPRLRPSPASSAPVSRLRLPRNRRDLLWTAITYYDGGPAYYAAPPAYYGGGPVYYGDGGGLLS